MRFDSSLLFLEYSKFDYKDALSLETLLTEEEKGIRYLVFAYASAKSSSDLEIPRKSIVRTSYFLGFLWPTGLKVIFIWLASHPVLILVRF